MGYGNFNDLYAQPAWKRNPQAAMQQYMQQRVQLAQYGAQQQGYEGRMSLQQSGRQLEEKQFKQKLDWFTERSEKAREQAESMQMQRSRHQYGQQMKGMYHRREMAEMGEQPSWQTWGGIGLQAMALPIDFATQQQQQKYYRGQLALQQAQMGHYGGQA